MEENEDILDIDGVNPDQPRPTFITVLCILTFVGAGLGFLGAIWSFFAMSQVQNTFDAFNRLDGFNDTFPDTLDNFYRWTKISMYLNLLGNALCLTGALLMWNLKKVGYFIYIPGQVIPLIGSFMVISSMTGSIGGVGGPGSGFFASFGMVGFFISAIIPAAFVIMYGVNLKYMNK